jgi:hypothetical protein
MDKSPNNEYIDENNGEPQGLPDTENKQGEFCEFFEKCEEEDNGVLRVLWRQIEGCKIVFEVIDKIISFDV